MGDDFLGCAAATDDGGVVVGGNVNGTYNAVASEGLVDFIAIKLGTYVLNVSACSRCSVTIIQYRHAIDRIRWTKCQENTLTRAARSLIYFSPPISVPPLFGPSLD